VTKSYTKLCKVIIFGFIRNVQIDMHVHT